MASQRPLFRHQTAAVLVRMLPSEKAELDALVPYRQAGPLLRRLLAEHLTEVRATQPELAPTDPPEEEATTAA